MPFHIPAPEPEELILPSRFNAPELLISNRKPLGSVTIDRSNKFAKGLVNACLFRDSKLENIASSDPVNNFTYPDPDDAQVVEFTEGGLHKNNNASADEFGWGSFDSNGTGLKTWAIAFLWKGISIGNSVILTDGETILDFEGLGKYFRIRQESDAIHPAKAFSLDGVNPVTGKLYIITASLKGIGTEPLIVVNGMEGTDLAASGTGTIDAFGNVFMFSEAANANSVHILAHFVACHNYSMDLTELTEYNRNIYQILKPALEVKYLPIPSFEILRIPDETFGITTRKPRMPVVFDGPENILDYFPILEDSGQTTKSIVTGIKATGNTGSELVIPNQGIITAGATNDRWNLPTNYYNDLGIEESIEVRLSMAFSFRSISGSDQEENTLINFLIDGTSSALKIQVGTDNFLKVSARARAADAIQNATSAAGNTISLNRVYHLEVILLFEAQVIVAYVDGQKWFSTFAFGFGATYQGGTATTSDGIGGGAGSNRSSEANIYYVLIQRNIWGASNPLCQNLYSDPYKYLKPVRETLQIPYAPVELLGAEPGDGSLLLPGRFNTPELLIPGRKPIGPLKLDESNSYAKKLFWGMIAGDPVNLKGNVPFTRDFSGAGNQVNNNRAIFCPDDSWYQITNAGDWSTTIGYTCIFKLRLNASLGFFHNCWSKTTAFDVLQLNFSQHDTNDDFLIEHESSNFNIFTNVNPSDFANTGFHTYVIRYDGGDQLELFVDGFDTYQKLTMADTAQATGDDTLRLGGPGNEQAAFDTDCDFEYFHFFKDHFLTDDEVIEFIGNPYQLVKPKTEVSFFPDPILEQFIIPSTVIQPPKTFSDDFENTNGTDLVAHKPKWVSFQNSLEIQNNAARATVNNVYNIVGLNDDFTEDQYAEITIISTVVDNQYGGPVVKLANIPGTRGYSWITNGDDDTFYISFFDGFTSIPITVTGPVPVDGDLMRLEMRGNVLTFILNGIIVDRRDETLTDHYRGGVPGLTMSGTATTIAAASWSGGSLDSSLPDPVLAIPFEPVPAAFTPEEIKDLLILPGKFHVPSLFIPKRTPKSSEVVVDWANPLTEDLLSCFIWDSLEPYDLAGNIPFSAVDRNGSGWKVDNGGLYLNRLASNQITIADADKDFELCVSNTVSWGIMHVFRFDPNAPSDANEYTLSQTVTGDTSPIEVDLTTFGITLYDGQIHCLILTCKNDGTGGDRMDLWLDGILLGTTSVNSSHGASHRIRYQSDINTIETLAGSGASTNLLIGGTIQSSGDRWQGHLMSFTSWKRFLVRGEARNLSMNPYQILKPNREVLYYPTPELELFTFPDKQVQGSMEFDEGASAEHRLIGDFNLDDYPVTMGCWFFDKGGVTNDRALMQISDTSLDSDFFRLGKFGTRVGHAVSNWTITNVPVTTINTYGQNTWNSIIARYAQSDTRVQLNQGNEETDGTDAGIVSGIDGISIGWEGDSTPGDPWHGYIAHCFVYKGEMSTSQKRRFSQGILPDEIFKHDMGNLFYLPLQQNLKHIGGFNSQTIMRFESTTTGSLQFKSNHPPVKWINKKLLRVPYEPSVVTDGFNLPDPRFEAPELFIPKRQPAVSLTIDWDHPMAENLKLCVMPRYDQELANNFPIRFISDMDTPIRGNEGFVFETDGSLDVVELVGSEELVLEDGQPLTIIARFKVLASDAEGTIIGHRDGASRNWQFYTQLDGTIGMALGLGTNDDNVGVTGDLSGKWVTAAVTWDGNTSSDHYYDGIFERSSSVFSSSDPIQTALGPVSLGARWETYPTTGYEGDFYIVYAFVWYGRKMNPGEIRSMYYNPYQFLIPS